MGRCPIERDQVINDKLIIIEKLGKGCYGDVYKCKNKFTNSSSALKINKNDESYLYSIKNELKILKKLKEFINKFHLKSYIPLLYEHFIYNNHHCFHMELYRENLFNYQKMMYNNYTPDLVLKLSYKIIKGMNFIKENNIIHCDLKPENILFTQDYDNIVICDFGLSELVKNHSKKNYHCEVQSIWYRAPEIGLRGKYNYKIDIWTIGTILYEILFNKALFVCNTNEELILKITKCLGFPSINLADDSKDFFKYFFINKNSDVEYLVDIKIDNNFIDKDYLLNKFKIKKILKSIYKIIVKSLVWDMDDRIDYDEMLKILS